MSSKISLWAVFVSIACLHANSGYGATAEEKCQAARAKAWGTYVRCEQNGIATIWNEQRVQTWFGCHIRYENRWPQLQSRADLAGSTCAGPRFVDNGDGTVTDNLTALQWEQKTSLDGTVNLSDPHDADNDYSWSADSGFPMHATGTAYSDFLSALDGGCFAGECDWRIPGLTELYTIVLPVQTAIDNHGAVLCSANGVFLDPCIDPAFGPTQGSSYMTSTAFPESPFGIWVVDFSAGSNATAFDGYARAVRGGL